MATPGELVRCISSVLNISEPTVIQYDRNLAAAGLRSKGGRGLSAARVNAQDAANLLIAIVGAPMSGATVKETEATWGRFSPLRALPSISSISSLNVSNFSKLKRELPTLGRLRKGHSFKDAVAALIESAALGEFDNQAEIPVDRSIDPRVILPKVSVTMQAPFISADIRVCTKRVPLGCFVAYYPKKDELYADNYGDLSQHRSISLRTILTIAQTIGASKNAAAERPVKDRKKIRAKRVKARLAERPK